MNEKEKQKAISPKHQKTWEEALKELPAFIKESQKKEKEAERKMETK